MQSHDCWMTGETKHERSMEDIMAIDYERMQRTFPKHKAALTRANKKVGSVKYPAVLAACKAAVKEWDAIGAWPDNWATFNIALGDAAFYHARLTGQSAYVAHLHVAQDGIKPL